MSTDETDTRVDQASGPTIPTGAEAWTEHAAPFGDPVRPGTVAPGPPPDSPAVASDPRAAAGLPTPVSSFVGRAREIAEVSRLLSAARLVTLTGPGGCGKTRLAVEVARRLAPRFADGAVFVSLAPLDDPDLVARAVAGALGVRDIPTRSCWESVADALAARTLLLVVDNVEHVLDAAEELAAWLRSCRGLTILATSRERLRVQGESVYRVPPLALPEAAGPGPGASAGPGGAPEGSEAVRLFVERARAVEPRFALAAGTAPVVAEICRRLDGLPLAIELAAARAHMLSPNAMLARLNGATASSPLELLTGGARDLPLRQQTLRRTIAWSYDLLAPEEQAMFRRLSVFVGGFGLEQAEAVCHAAPTPLTTGAFDLIASLVERSLLRPVGAPGAEPRFAMLETIREFARDLLDGSGEGMELRRRHADYYVRFAERAASQLHGPHQASWLDTLELEHDELRAAMAWCAAHDVRASLRLGGALWRFWQVRGHVREGLAWLERVLAPDGADRATPPSPERASALNAAAFLAFMAGDYDRAAARHRETLAIRRELGDREGVAESLNSLGLVLRCVGDHEAADALFDEALAVSRSLGNRAREANILNNLARSAYYRGDYAAARARHEQALAVGREAGDAWAVAICLGDLGDVHHARGDPATARRLYEESLAAWQALGDLRGVAQCLEGFAGLIVEAEPARAVRLFGAAVAVRETIGEPCSPVRRAGLDRTLERAREALGPARYAEAWGEGRAMPLDRAVAYAREPAGAVEEPVAGPGGGSPSAGRGPLTRRELEVARLAAEGRSNREIAEALVVSERTVGTHLEHIYAKLGVSSRTAVAAYVFRQGLT